ncbi:MAG: hypothetical protein V2J10_03170 [Wenzhouxiangella sp.]|nr:hypothetical protein [Wenzhouxiangella sp.]
MTAMPGTTRSDMNTPPRWLAMLTLTLGSVLTTLPSLARSACDCACEGYARLIQATEALNPTQDEYLDRCGGACAIAWTRCDQAMTSASDLASPTQAEDVASYTSDYENTEEDPMNEPSRREQFIESLKGRLDELNGEIEQLENRAREASDQAGEAYRQRLEDVREKRVELEHKLKGLRAASEAQFERLKLEAEHTWKAFRNSVSYFRSHFK